MPCEFRCTEGQTNSAQHSAWQVFKMKEGFPWADFLPQVRRAEARVSLTPSDIITAPPNVLLTPSSDAQVWWVGLCPAQAAALQTQLRETPESAVLKPNMFEFFRHESLFGDRSRFGPMGLSRAPFTYCSCSGPS